MKCSKIVPKTSNGRFSVVSQPACQVTSRSLVVMLAEVMRKQAVACGRQSDLNSATQTVESDLGRSLHHRHQTHELRMAAACDIALAYWNMTIMVNCNSQQAVALNNMKQLWAQTPTVANSKPPSTVCGYREDC